MKWLAFTLGVAAVAASGQQNSKTHSYTHPPPSVRALAQSSDRLTIDLGNSPVPARWLLGVNVDPAHPARVTWASLEAEERLEATGMRFSLPKNFDPMAGRISFANNRLSFDSASLGEKTLIVYVELATAREIEIIRSGEVVHLSKPADRLLLDSAKVLAADRLSFSRLKSLAVNPSSLAGPTLTSASEGAKLNKWNGQYIPTPALVLQNLLQKTPLPTKSNPVDGVRGAMTYTLTVGPTGDVIRVQMRGIRGPESDRIATLLKEWKFSPFENEAEPVSVIFPLTFFVDAAGNHLGPLEFRPTPRHGALASPPAAETCCEVKASAPRSGR